MIHVNRSDKPVELSDEVQKELTAQYKADNNKVVWGMPFIRKALLKMSNNKCVYCECLVGKGTVDMHVDHFQPKSIYPDLVVVWDNLLPSCPDCNRAKSSLDTKVYPIINPSEVDPHDYFYMFNYRYKSKDPNIDSIASRTIDILQLNDSSKKVIKRFEIGEVLHDKLTELVRLAGEHENDINNNIRVKNRVKRGCRDLLHFGKKEAEYSAFMATTIHNDSEYTELKRILKEKNLWDGELESLDKETKANAYEIKG